MKQSAGAGSGLQRVEHDGDRAEIRLLGEEERGRGGSTGLNRDETSIAVRPNAGLSLSWVTALGSLMSNGRSALLN